MAKAICDEHLKEFAQTSWHDNDDDGDDLLINFQRRYLATILITAIFKEF